MTSRAPVFIVALLLAVSGTAAASAAVTVGSDLTVSSGGAACADASRNCMIENNTLNYAVSGVPNVGGYPGNGVIVR